MRMKNRLKTEAILMVRTLKQKRMKCNYVSVKTLLKDIKNFELINAVRKENK